MNKKEFKVILTMVLIIVMNMSVFANYSDNSSYVWTGSIAGPSIRPGYETQSKQYNITSEIYSCCLGSNSYIRIKTMGSINSKFASSDSRIFTMKLWERDSSNSDDLVCSYKGTFVGRKLSTFGLSEREDTGYIESQGDSTAEFYTMSSISKCSYYEWGEVFSGSFCTYEIGMR